MIRTIGMCLYVAGYLLCALPLLVYSKYLEKKDPIKHEQFCRKKIVAFAKRCLKVAGTKVELSGLENIPEEATLTVFNHQGLFDAFILIGCIPNTYCIVAKKELEKVPLLSDWMRAGRCLFIDRSSVKAGMQVIHKGVENLKNGINVSIAPEGTRNNGIEMLEFKGGAFMMATKAEAPILPVVIDGTHRIFEANGHRIKPATVRVKILPPIPTKGMDRSAQKALPEQVRALMQDTLSTIEE